MKTTYLSAAATAKLIRAQLKRHFPGTKFGVRSRSYAGGASIDVSWIDGPSQALVDPVVQQFQGSRFDGMIDMKHSLDCWLLLDGTATVASDPGTEGSGGMHPARREWMPDPEARLVSFGADHVFTTRRLSPAFAERVLASARRRSSEFDRVEIHVSDYDGSASFRCDDYEVERRLWRHMKRFMIARATA